MPKNQFIDPIFMRSKGKISFSDIPVNEYSKTVGEERKNFSDAQLTDIFYRMRAVREFETAVSQMREDGYRGVKHKYNGPLHLSVGQEAAAVGQAFTLGKDDMIFGSHRAHAELLTRGLTATATFSDDELLEIMKNYGGGYILKVVEKHNKSGNIRDLAEDFLYYGALSEIYAKSTGFQKGLSGSMHLFFTPFGVYPNNAIVGASAPIATGAALYKKIRGKKGIVISNTGDGAFGCGVVYEAMNFAAMDQYRLLWDKKGGLPILFAVSDNGYGMGGQTRGETMAFDFLARLGAGISPSQLHAERIDGNNPLAVIDAYRRKKKILEDGGGPVLLDVVTYRLEGHSQSDKSSYRDEVEIEAWKAHDPLKTYPEALIRAGVLTKSGIEEIQEKISGKIQKICSLVADDRISPYYDFNKDPGYLERVLFSDKKADKFGEDKPLTLIPKEENARVKEISGLSRIGESGITVRDAIFEAVIDKFYRDPSLVSYGEDVREWGGICGVYRGLSDSLPYQRLFNSPISEAAIVSTAVGYAMSGGRVIIEIMFSDFMARAADEIFNQLAKWQSMSAGELKLPVALRVSIGAKYGTQHSQDWTALVSHIPGLKVVYPATPYDCKGLLNSALSGTDPVIFFESQRIYKETERFTPVPKDYYEIAIGEPDIKRTGTDITLFTVGANLYRTLEAAEILAKDCGIEAEIVDARSIVPFNYDKLAASVKKTGLALLIGDAAERGSVLKEFSHNIGALCFGSLKAPPAVLGGKNTVIPPYEYDRYYFPQTEDIVKAAIELVNKKKTAD